MPQARLTSDAPIASEYDHELGYGPLDDVHKEFLVLVDALARSADAGMEAALDQLIVHTTGHFALEERWMAETAFPARECHADEHSAVMRSMKAVGRRVARGESEPVRTLVEALREWFPGHATHLDSALAHWMCQRRLGGAPVVLHRTRGQHVLDKTSNYKPGANP